MPYRPGTNTGHGWVWTRPDHTRARCGGPALCAECAQDMTDKMNGVPYVDPPIEDNTPQEDWAANLKDPDTGAAATPGQ